MKGRQVVLGHLFGVEAAALMQDGQLIDLLVASDPLTALAPGAICRASTDRFMKGQGGVFLRLPDGQTGYLRDRKGVAPRLYIATSSEPGILKAAQPFEEMLKRELAPGSAFQYVPMPQETHGTIYHPAALQALRQLFKPAAP